MSVDMHRAGYRSICNIDYSSVCIHTMSTRHADCPGMSWLQMDARQLSFPDGSFDVVLEKATLDAMLVAEKDPWEVSSDAACLIHRVLSEVSSGRGLPRSEWKRRGSVFLVSGSVTLTRKSSAHLGPYALVRLY